MPRIGIKRPIVLDALLDMNGLVFDYDPGNISLPSLTAISVDPTAQVWSPRSDVPIPSAGSGHVPFAGRFASSGVGVGYYRTVKSSAGVWFSSNDAGFGLSGSSEPSVGSPIDGALVWQSSGFTWLTSRANSTHYTFGDCFAQSGKVWVCFQPGNSAGSLPAGYATADYNQSVTDGTAAFISVGRFAGAWAGTTSYGRYPKSDRGFTYPDYVTVSSGTVLLQLSGMKDTFQATGATEPAWGSAVAGTGVYYLDGGLSWHEGSYSAGGGSSGGQERLVITGYGTSGSPPPDGKRVRTKNIGIDDMSVILADQTGLGGTDAESAFPFDFSGTDQALQADDSMTVVFDEGSGVWVPA